MQKEMHSQCSKFAIRCFHFAIVSSPCPLCLRGEFMHFEVEQKHRVDDVAALDARLAERGVTLGPPVEQSDQYFAHPCRDFARTDEALRIRTVGEASFVTYKGPKLDATTKTRRELELPLDPSDADGSQFAELLTALGFTPVATVRKQRRPFHIDVARAASRWRARRSRRRRHVRRTGTDGRRSRTWKRPSASFATLADELQLGPSERRSYLDFCWKNNRAAKNLLSPSSQLLGIHFALLT